MRDGMVDAVGADVDAVDVDVVYVESENDDLKFAHPWKPHVLV